MKEGDKFILKTGEVLPYHIDHFERFIGEELGVSSWYPVTQEAVDQFAKATNDHNRLHVDPDWAKANSPFGGTIAHGFFTLSLLSHFSFAEDMQPDGVDYGINYGFERVRFMAPVPVGDRVRNRSTLIHAAAKGTEKWMFRTRNAIEMESSGRVALSAVWEVLFVRDARVAAAAQASAEAG